MQSGERKRKCLKCGSEMQLLNIEKDYRSLFGVIYTWMCPKCHTLSRQATTNFDYATGYGCKKETKHE